MDADDEGELRAVLLRLERAIAERRLDDLPAGGYQAVIHEAFHETGASGRRWSREATLAALNAADVAEVPISGFDVDRIAPDCALVTYDIGGPRPTRRASLWVRDGTRWRMRFHQGTLL